MPPAEQIHRLDSGQRADKDPLDLANDFLHLITTTGAANFTHNSNAVNKLIIHEWTADDT